MSWEEVALVDVCEVGRGSSPRPINDTTYFEGGDIPWIKIADATASGKYIYETKEYVNSYGASFSRLLPPNSLILATSGVSLGQVKFLGIKGCIHDGWLYLKNYKGIDKEFLYYKLICLQDYFHGNSYGAAIQNINTDILRRTKVNLPPLQTQKRIANILSAYDDLIENNLKRIKLLEKAAQNIYKEWFVNLRFPGYEKTPINKETGLPEGWEKINLYDFAQIQMGYAFKAKDFNDKMVGRPAIRIRDILDNWTKTYTAENVDEKYSVEHGDILIGMDGIFHMGIWSGQKKAFLVQRVCRLRANNMNLQGYLLESLRAPISHYEQTISGATVAHLGTKHLREIFIRVPGGEFLKKLSIFNTINSKTIILNKQNQKLKAARDILLPRLMNRTIEV